MTTAREALDAFHAPLAGTVLIEASAGTGKTHTITTLFVRLVLERGLSVGEVLVVTFTEAATAELRERVRARLRLAVRALSGQPTPEDPELARFAEAEETRALYRARAEAALRELDLSAISTIHAFCMRALQEHAFESGAELGLELMADTSVLIDELTADYWASRVCELPRALYLLRHGRFELATARAIISALARRPADVPVLPDPGEDEPAPDYDAVRAAFREARRAWQGASGAVRDLLLDARVMNQRSYSSALVDRYVGALDAWFEAEEPVRAVPFDALAKLSPASIAAGTKKGNAPPDHPVFARLEALGALLGALRDAFLRDLRLGAVSYVRRELPARKAALRVQGFEDLLFSLDAALRGPRAPALHARLLGRHRAALIDEFQDTDPVQYRIFHRIFHDSDGALLLVGDPKQSIYAFRGADVFSYVHATRAASRIYTLGENRRSDPSLVRAVNTLFARVRDPFLLDVVGFEPVAAHHAEDRLRAEAKSPPFEILFVPRGADKALGKGWLKATLPRAIAAEIARFLRSGASIAASAGSPERRAVRPGDVAVLTRTNEQARLVQAELRKLRVPTTLQSDESVFASDEAADVELLLSAILHPTRSGAVRSALATVVAGLDAEELASLDGDERAWDRWSGRFREWQAHWDEHGFIHAYRRMLAELGATERLLGLVDGERRVTNLIHTGELLHGVATRGRLGRTALVRWLGLARGEGDEASDLGREAEELRLESDAHAVQLLTIHKSKGLEFPIVYCPFLFDVRLPGPSDVAIDFHDPSDGFALKIDVDPRPESPSIAAKEREVLSEGQRLLYVALTRAKHRCSIVWGGINQAERSPLAYALHQPPDGAGGEDLQRRAAERYRASSDAELRADLGALAAAAGGAIAIVDFDVEEPGPAYEAPVSAGASELSARTFERGRVGASFRMGSFSALSQRDLEDARHADPEALGLDRDEVDERASLAPPAAGPPERDAAPREVAEGPVLLHAFPRGARAGTMLHDVLEHLDFTSADGAALRALVRDKLEAAGYADEQWGETLTSGVRAMMAAPLDPAGLRLADVPRARRIDELEFVLPVARGGEALTARRLAEALEAHPGGDTPASYAARLGSLRFPPLRGFLKGFIDLVFEHDGRFYVVDYKSNHLGPSPEDYRAEALVRAMTHHDYVLQYHLYVVAVHRWLLRRLRGYDYDRHFGGVYYLFLRGMSPDHPTRGVFADRPPRERTEALSRALEGEA